MTLAQLKNENTEVKLDDLDLKTTDFENTLNVYQDKRNNWFYNLNVTTKLDIDENLILKYTCTHDSFWPLISYNLYGSARLSWLLMQLNNVTIVTAFRPVFAGEEIKYISKDYVRTIINSLLNYNK